MSKRGRTAQLVVAERKVLHVDELAKLGGDFACQRNGRSFSASGRLVCHMSKRVLTGQVVFRKIKVRQVDELAKFGGD